MTKRKPTRRLSPREVARSYQKTIVPQTFHDPNFGPQCFFVQDTNPRVLAQCTRRAGKTVGLARRFLTQMNKHPGETCRYIALTRDSAREIMWPVLRELDTTHKLGADFTESNLTMTLPNGARLKLFGADMTNFIKRLKGVRSPAVGIDEAQDFGAHLQSLIQDVIEPALLDFSDSWLALTGTPGALNRGVFYDACHGTLGFSVHKWSLLQNPYLPNPGAFIETLKRRNNWLSDNPTLLREYGNQWVKDLDALFIKYDPDRNHYDTLPDGRWRYIMGVDLGINDADAICVLAWNEFTPNLYLVHEDITRGQDITTLAGKIRKYLDTYQVEKIVVDEGALGKKIAEEIRKRYALPVQAADKARKFENATFLNDFLLAGRFKANRASAFATDSATLQVDYERSTPTRLVLKPGHHSDIIDAVLYAFKEAHSYLFKNKPAPLLVGSPEWGKAEEARMEADTLERLQREEEIWSGA